MRQSKQPEQKLQKGELCNQNKTIWETKNVVLLHLSKGQLSKGQLSKGTNVQGTVVQGDVGPRRLLSKDAFTSENLAQIIFLFSI